MCASSADELADAPSLQTPSQLGTTVVGVGPMPKPWPDDPRLDPELLASGDRRNVIDRYRYWTMEAIVADLDAQSVVRTANAFNVAAVHILGRRRWNRRGAMVTDRYLHVYHHSDVPSFLHWLDEHGVTPVGVDNLPGSVPLETVQLPQDCCLVFGSEGPGLTDEVVKGCEQLVAITQYGSTRSMNAGAAAAIAMYAWTTQWCPKPRTS